MKNFITAYYRPNGSYLAELVLEEGIKFMA
jgi:hypothetical protein